MTATTEDLIDHPSHYIDGRDIEPIEVIDDWQLGFYEAQVLKYISRAGRKDDRLQDLEKAQWYLDRLIANIQFGLDIPAAGFKRMGWVTEDEEGSHPAEDLGRCSLCIRYEDGAEDYLENVHVKRLDDGSFEVSSYLPEEIRLDTAFSIHELGIDMDKVNRDISEHIRLNLSAVDDAKDMSGSYL